MQYRTFGKLDWKVSALGFGAMRLPETDGRIDEGEATRMVRYAIDHGVNYVDTAYPYHDGESEAFLGRALSDGYRARVKLVTKLPSWKVESIADCDKLLDVQLERLRQESVDIYLLHALNAETWTKLRDLGVLDWAEHAMARGRFHRLGFSFHDDYNVFAEIVDGYDSWAMAQIQYNYMDVENQAGTKGLEYAASKGLALAIMEPLLGGKLVAPPAPVQALWDAARAKRTPAAWALAWLWNQPGVSTVLSGMSTLEQVVENVEVAGRSGIGMLVSSELELFDGARNAYRRLMAVPCTGCRYCMPCPQGVDIPGNFGMYNGAVMYDKPEAVRGQYAWQKRAFEELGNFDHDIRAERCIQCRTCEEKCPQSIPISRWMPVVHRALGENGPFVLGLNAKD